MTTILNPTNKFIEKTINNYVLFADESFNVFNISSSSILKDLKNFTKSITPSSKKRDFLIFNLILF